MYSNVENLVNDPSLQEGQFVSTAGYYTPGDSGGNDYQITSNISSNLKVDNGSVIKCGALYAVGLFRNGINVFQFGASSDHSKTADTTNNDAAFQAAIEFAGKDSISYSLTSKSVVQIPKNIVIGKTINIDKPSVSLDFSGGSVTASDSFPVDNYLIEVTGDHADVLNFSANGNNRSGGIRYTNTGGESIRMPNMTRIHGIGLSLDGGWSGDIFDPQMAQWDYNSAELSDQSNLTGTMIYINTHDCSIYGGSLSVCKIGIHLGPKCVNARFYGTHPWQGAGDGSSKRIDPINIYAEEGSSAQFYGAYLDNGKIISYTSQLQFFNPFPLLSKDAVEFKNGTMIDIYATATDNGNPSEFVWRCDNIWMDDFKIVNFLNSEDGKYVWYPEVSNVANKLNGFYSRVEVQNNKITMRAITDTNIADWTHLSSGPIRWDMFPNNTDIARTLTFDNSGTLAFGNVQYYHLNFGDNNTAAILFGSNSLGVSNSYSKDSLSLSTGSVERIRLTDVGDWLPMSAYNGNNEQSLGHDQQRWNYVYLKNSPNVTSDESVKTDIQFITPDEIRAALSIKPRRYKLKDDEQGKIHFGYIAQEVAQSLRDNGLDPDDYSFIHQSSETGLYSLQYDEIQNWIEAAKFASRVEVS